MRDDQYQRLQSLAERLTDVVLDEANPAEWPGADKKLADLDRDTRGDRYWCKKNAAATLSLLTRVYTITGIVERHSSRPTAEDNTNEEDDIEKEITAAEKAADKALKGVIDRVYGHKAKAKP